MKCNEIKFDTGDCGYNIMLPYLYKSVYDNTDEPPKPKTVTIDKCLLPEILTLWEKGIKTTGCCCGHGKSEFAFIGVSKEFIPKMKDMGYKVWFNEHKPNSEDSFIPKTVLNYGDADKGFNWWDK